MAFWPSYCDNLPTLWQCSLLHKSIFFYSCTFYTFRDCTAYYFLLEVFSISRIMERNIFYPFYTGAVSLIKPNTFCCSQKNFHLSWLSYCLKFFFYGELPKPFWNPPLWEKSKKVRAITVSRQLVWSLKFLMLWIYQWYQSYSLYIYSGCTVRIFVHIQIFFLFE
jgi:hypothetical protein